MELSRVQRALLTLVRAGLWEKNPDDPESLRLSSGEWKEVFNEAMAQTVVGLLWRGIDNVEDENLMPDVGLLQKLAVEVDRCENRYRDVRNLCVRLFEEFDQKGFHPLLLKGIASAELYVTPELRPSGDIDIFFPADEFDKAVPEGAEKESDGGVAYEIEGITVEHHRLPLDVSSKKNIKFIDTLLARESLFSTTDGLRTVGPLLTMLLLDTHVLKHFIGRGVGLRQCCDFARARKVLKYDREAFESACEKMGITRWTAAFEELCDKYLGAGTDPETGTGAAAGQEAGEKSEDRYAGVSPDAEKILQRVLSDGNFGRKQRNADSGALSTLWAFVSHFGYSVRISPRETLATISALAGGRLSR